MLSRLAPRPTWPSSSASARAPTCRSGTPACAATGPATASPAPPRRSRPPRPGRRRLGQRPQLPAGRPGRPVQLRPDRRDDVLATLRARAARACTRSATRPSTSTAACPGSPSAAWSSSPRGHAPVGRIRHGRPPPTTTPLGAAGHRLRLHPRPGQPARGRVEFSIHPLVAGVRQTHTIVWEAERVDPSGSPTGWPGPTGSAGSSATRPSACWSPTCHSRAGHHRRRPAVSPVPLRPPTGSGERCSGTCPAEPAPGRFLTQRGWRDPFALLAAEDPSGTGYRRRARPGRRPRPLAGRRLSPDAAGGPPRVEGRARRRGLHAGQGRAGPAPDRVLRDVRAGARAAAALGPVRFECSTTAPAPGWSSSTWPRPPGYRHHHPPGNPVPLAPLRPGPWAWSIFRWLIATVALPRASRSPATSVSPPTPATCSGRASIPSRLAGSS